MFGNSFAKNPACCPHPDEISKSWRFGMDKFTWVRTAFAIGSQFRLADGFVLLALVLANPRSGDKKLREDRKNLLMNLNIL